MDIQYSETIRDSIRGFDGVWKRVTTQEQSGTSAPAENTSHRSLRSLIRQERQNAHDLRCIARRMGGMTSRSLASLASEAEQRARALSAEYFIATGEMLSCDTDDAPEGGCLCALREAYERSGSLAERYDNASSGEDDSSLECLYERFAADNRRAACMLRSMITRCF